MTCIRPACRGECTGMRDANGHEHVAVSCEIGYSDAAKPPIRRNGNRPSGGRKPQVLVNAAEPLVRCGVSHQSGQT